MRQKKVKIYSKNKIAFLIQKRRSNYSEFQLNGRHWDNPSAWEVSNPASVGVNFLLR